MKSESGMVMPQLTPLQQAYMVGGRRDFDLHVYPHLYLEFDVEDVDEARLETAVLALVQRHPLLRVTVSDQGSLVVEEDIQDYSVNSHYLVGLSDEERQVRLQKIRQRLLRREFEPYSVPRIHVELTRTDQWCRVHVGIDLMLFDGSAVRLLLSELSRLYENGDLEGDKVEESASPGLGVSEAHRERSRRYWMKRLKSMPDAPSLPLRAHAGEPRRSNLIRHRHQLNADEWRKLTLKCELEGVSPATLLLATYSRVVAGYSRHPHFYLTVLRQGQADNQRSPAAQNQASTMLVEVDYGERRTFREQLHKLHARLMRDMSRSGICGLDVLAELNRQDSSVTRAASPVAFVAMLEPPRTGTTDLFQLEGRNMVFSALETPQVVLDHQAIRRDDGGVALVWDVMDQAFEPGVVDAMFSAYVRHLDLLIEDECFWDSTIFDCRTSEQVDQNHIYNKTSLTLKKGLLHSYLRDTPLHLDEKVAVADGDVEITYGALRRITNRLAWTLKEKWNAGPGDCVAVDLPKGWHQVVAVQAILLTGAAYVPLGYHQPKSRKQSILEQCQPVGSLLLEPVTDYPCPFFAMNQPQAWSEREEDLPDFQQPEDTAYIIFTSGSTGTPKGVVLDHRGPVNTIEDINRRFHITSGDVIFGLSELNFDLSVYDIFGAFAAGATLVIAPEGVSRDPAWCERLLRRHGVTIWNSVPALAQLLLEHLERQLPEAPLPLRFMMLSGDWLPVQLPQRMWRYTPVRIVSLGGATEASIWSIFYEVAHPDPDWKSIPYGFPLANQSIHVMDALRQPRPDHVPGELYIGGEGLAKGYWGAPEKTRHAFIRHPDTGERLYRTGDWGVRRPEGFIEFLGREDGQVKVRGFRIELGEIESQLQRCPGIENAVVHVVGDSTADSSLVACVVCKAEDFDSRALTASLEERLPNYMVPRHIIRLDALPLNANGKVDRKALPKPGETDRAKEKVPPAGEIECRLAEVWQSILNKPVMSRHDNFFTIGGTSFSAVRMLAAIEQHFSRTLPMQALIRNPQLAALAQQLDGSQGNMQSWPGTSLVPLSSVDNQGAPLAWFHPSGGNVLCYREIAAQLSPWFNSAGLEARHSEVGSVEALVSDYLSEIDAFADEGPCMLAGWSLGGVLAYQAAYERLRRGQSVDGLIMIDAPAPGFHDMPDEATCIQWFLGDLVQDPVLPALELPPEGDIKSRLYEGVRALQRQGRLPEDDSLPLNRLFQQFRSHLHVLRRYVPPSLTRAEFPCLVIAASDPLSGRVAENSAAYWNERLPATTNVKTLKANHYSIMQPSWRGQLISLIHRHILPASFVSLSQKEESVS